jgi:hypothetical protein
MVASVEWWELVMPQTVHGSADAWVRVRNGRAKLMGVSEKAKGRLSEVMQALREARAGAPSPAFPWRKVKRLCRPGQPGRTGCCEACALEKLYGNAPKAKAWRAQLLG